MCLLGSSRVMSCKKGYKVYEYKVISAPRKGLKAKGIKSHEDRFANSLQELMNSKAHEGWEFVRAETLPSEERSGFRSTNVVYRSVLVFRKKVQEAAEEFTPAPPPVWQDTAPSQFFETLPEPVEAESLDDDQDSSKANA